MEERKPGCRPGCTNTLDVRGPCCHPCHAADVADLNAKDARADELRRACAELLKQDPETWPSHGNANLAIASAIALGEKARDEINAMRALLAEVAETQPALWTALQAYRRER